MMENGQVQFVKQIEKLQLSMTEMERRYQSSIDSLTSDFEEKIAHLKYELTEERELRHSLQRQEEETREMLSSSRNDYHLQQQEICALQELVKSEEMKNSDIMMTMKDSVNVLTSHVNQTFGTLEERSVTLNKDIDYSF